MNPNRLVETEEVLRQVYHTRLGAARMRLRFILAGTPEETRRMREQIAATLAPGEDVEEEVRYLARVLA